MRKGYIVAGIVCERNRICLGDEPGQNTSPELLLKRDNVGIWIKGHYVCL